MQKDFTKQAAESIRDSKGSLQKNGPSICGDRASAACFEKRIYRCCRPDSCG